MWFKGANTVASVTYRWEAKVYERPSMWGIRDGRVSVLRVWLGDAELVCYERGGDTDGISEDVLLDILYSATNGAEGKVGAA